MPKGHSKSNAEKSAERKSKAREREVRKANNILVNNVSLKERARRRGESTDTESTQRIPFAETLAKMVGKR